MLATIIMLACVPAALHVLQAQQVDGQQSGHSLATSRWVGAHVQLKRADVARCVLA